MTFRIHLLIVLGVASLLVLSAQQAPPDSQTGSSNLALADPTGSGSSKVKFSTRNPRYQVRPGDVLDFSFSPAMEFNQTVTVQPDGFLTLREAGDVYVQGKTVSEVLETVTSAYKSILHDPVITAVLKDFEKPHFIVGGQVGHPGKFELRADTTASEAVAIAGGITEKARHDQVLLFRRASDDWVEVKRIDLKEIYKGNLKEDIHLRPDDMIFVPQNRISKIKPFLPTSAVSAYIGGPL